MNKLCLGEVIKTCSYNIHLTWFDRLLLVELYWCMNNNGETTIDNCNLASILNVATQSISRSLKKLEEQKFIKRLYKNNNRILTLQGGCLWLY